MSKMNRMQRWRQQQREAGKAALTLYLPRTLKWCIEDTARKRDCSPSDLIQQAFTDWYLLSPDVPVTVTRDPNAFLQALAEVPLGVRVASQARELFDMATYYLGKLCPNGHDFEGTGQSLLRKDNQHCRACEDEGKRAARQPRRGLSQPPRRH